VHGSVLLIEFGAIVLALGILAAVAARFSISPIPLYLLAGLAFGQGGVLDLQTSEKFVEAGAEIGVILLLFTLGLEYTARVGGHAALVGPVRADRPGAERGARAGMGVAARIRAGAAILPRGEFNVVIAGPALGVSGIDPRLGPLAAAYVLILAVTGPLAARGRTPGPRGDGTEGGKGHRLTAGLRAPRSADLAVVAAFLR
jgi:CPA2 family monovalent cation:H+ antiporter-2